MQPPLAQGEKLCVGVLVQLGSGVPLDFIRHTAVVLVVEDNQCTVSVFDVSGPFSLGQCCSPTVGLVIVKRCCRLGRRVVVQRMLGQATRDLNGLVGTIVPHPRAGHPFFLPSAAGSVHHNVCIDLDCPPSRTASMILVESRFIDDVSPRDGEPQS